MDAQTFWLENLGRFKTLNELRQSTFFAVHGKQIESYLRTPQVLSVSGVSPVLHSFVRVVQWNIEKGKRFPAILELLQTNEILKMADVIILNEADRGMARSSNRNVVAELAEALRMHAVFGAAHFELTKGVDEELLLDGPNGESQQGNAILSRYPIAEAGIVPLPATFEPYEFHEKRYGSRICLWARLQLKDAPLWVGAVHLELRNTPRCRAKQVRHIVQHLPCTDSEAVILGGDLNTNTFGRGTRWRTLNAILRLLLNAPAKLQKELLYPNLVDEPLFRILESGGFEWNRMNSNEETARTSIDSLEEAGWLPDPVLRLFKRRLEPYRGFLCFKLDWLLGKNIAALGAGQKRDSGAGALSVNPGAVKAENFGPDRLSDHLPIYADLDLS